MKKRIRSASAILILVLILELLPVSVFAAGASVSTMKARNISTNTATLVGKVNANGGAFFSGYGFMYCKKSLSGNTAGWTTCGWQSGHLDSNVEYSYTVKGLEPDTEYVYEFYALSTDSSIGADGVVYGEVVSFWTDEEEAQTVTVDFDANGGSNAPGDISLEAGTTCRISNQIPQRSGYTFLGWSTEKNGTVDFDPGDKIKVRSNMTLYAVWEKEKSAPTCTFDTSSITVKVGDSFRMSGKVQGNGSSIAAVQISIFGPNDPNNGGTVLWRQEYSGDTGTVDLSKVPGFTWGDEINGFDTGRAGTYWICVYATTQDGLGFKDAVEKAVTVKEKEKATFTVTYNANGGSGAPGQTSVKEGEDYWISSQIPQRKGYVFQGWSTVKNGAVEYDSGDYIQIKSNLTLYAVWEKEKSAPTCTFDTSSITVKVGDSFRMSGKVQGNGNSIAAVQVSIFGPDDPNNGGTVLWRQEYTGDTGTVDLSKVPGFTWGDEINGFDTGRAGTYWICVYATTQDGLGFKDTVEKAVTVKEKEKETFTVTYNANGGSGAPGQASVKEGEDYWISSQIPQRSGYVFQGWSTVKNGVVEYDSGDYIQIKSNLTLYAVWEKEKSAPTCTFDTSSTTVKVGDSFRMSGKVQGNGSSIAAVQVSIFGPDDPNNGGTVLWRQEYTGDTGTVDLSRAPGFTWGDEINGFDTGRAGTYWICVYATTQDGLGFKDTVEKAVTVKEKEKETFTVTYNANGGSGAPGQVSVKEGEDYWISSQMPQRSGYVFQGWSTIKNGIVEYDSGDYIQIKSNLTLYAVWSSAEKEHWASEYIQYIRELGLIDDLGAEGFSPDTNIDRATMIAALYRLSGDVCLQNANYQDVPSNAWYADAVSWAKEHGVANGVSQTEFAPNATITREQMATMLYRYALDANCVDGSGIDADMTRFSDYSSVNFWAQEAMAWAVSVGLINGRTEKTLVPQGTATRAEAATILKRFNENILANRGIQDDEEVYCNHVQKEGTTYYIGHQYADGENPSEHIVEGVFWRSTCAICGQEYTLYVPEEPYPELHRFDKEGGGFCEACGYSCKHDYQPADQWVSGTGVYENLGSTHIRRSVVQYYVCSICGSKTKMRVDETGIAEPTPHVLRQEERINYNMENRTADGHYVTVEKWEYCQARPQGCDYHQFLSADARLEPHVFDAEGQCILCGYRDSSGIKTADTDEIIELTTQIRNGGDQLARAFGVASNGYMTFETYEYYGYLWDIVSLDPIGLAAHILKDATSAYKKDAAHYVLRSLICNQSAAELKSVETTITLALDSIVEISKNTFGPVKWNLEWSDLTRGTDILEHDASITEELQTDDVFKAIDRINAVGTLVSEELKRCKKGINRVATVLLVLSDYDTNKKYLEDAQIEATKNGNQEMAEIYALALKEIDGFYKSAASTLLTSNDIDSIDFDSMAKEIKAIATLFNVDPAEELLKYLNGGKLTDGANVLLLAHKAVKWLCGTVLRGDDMYEAVLALHENLLVLTAMEDEIIVRLNTYVSNRTNENRTMLVRSLREMAMYKADALDNCEKYRKSNLDANFYLNKDSIDKQKAELKELADKAADYLK